MAKKSSKRKILWSRKANKYLGVNVVNIVISKLVKTKTSSKYLIGYLDEVIRSIALILPKMGGYAKTFNMKDGDKDKNNKLISFGIDDEKLLEKYKSIWSKIKDLNMKLNALPVNDNRYIATKIRTHGAKLYTNFCVVKVPEDDIEYDSFIVISIDSLFVYENKYYLQVYLDNCAYKIVITETVGHLDDNLFKTD